MAFDEFGEGSIWDNADIVQESGVARVFDQPSFTVRDLFLAEDLVQEVKANNPKLISFLASAGAAADLVDALVSAPPLDDPDAAYRAPYMATEVLCCQVPSITQAVATSPCKDRSGLTALQRLLLFADGPTAARTFVSGYVLRVVEALAVAAPAALALAVAQTPGLTTALCLRAADPSVAATIAVLADLPFVVSTPETAEPRLSASDEPLPDALVRVIGAAARASASGASTSDPVTSCRVDPDVAYASVHTAAAALRLVDRARARPTAAAIEQGRLARLAPKASDSSAASGAGGVDVQRGAESDSVRATTAVEALTAPPPPLSAVGQAAPAEFGGSASAARGSVRFLRSLRSSPSVTESLAAVVQITATLEANRRSDTLGGHLSDSDGPTVAALCAPLELTTAVLDSTARDAGAWLGGSSAVATSASLSGAVVGLPRFVAHELRDGTDRLLRCLVTSGAITALCSALESRSSDAQSFVTATAVDADEMSGATPGSPATPRGIAITAVPLPSRRGSPRFGAVALACAQVLASFVRAAAAAPAVAPERAVALRALWIAVGAFPWHTMLHRVVCEATIDMLRRGGPAAWSHAILTAGLSSTIASLLAAVGMPTDIGDGTRPPRAHPARAAGYISTCLRVVNAIEAAVATGAVPTPVARTLEASASWRQVRLAALVQNLANALVLGPGAAASASGLAGGRGAARGGGEGGEGGPGGERRAVVDELGE